MKCKVVLNIDIIGTTKYLSTEDKGIFMSNIVEGITNHYRKQGKSVATEMGVYNGHPFTNDITIRIRTENEIIVIGNHNIEKADITWDANKTILERYKAHNDLRNNGYELFDVNVLITDMSKRENEQAITDSVMVLDSLSIHPEGNNAKVYTFVFDELIYKIVMKDGKPDHHIESAKDETWVKRVSQIIHYIDNIINTYEKHKSVEDYDKEIKEIFGKIVSLDSSDGLCMVTM